MVPFTPSDGKHQRHFGMDTRKYDCISMFRYKDALSLLRDANFPLEEAKRMCRNRVDLIDELAILEQDLYYQMCAAESLQACALGTFSLVKLACRYSE